MSRCREKGLFIYKNYRRDFITDYLQLFPRSPMSMLLHRRSIGNKNPRPKGKILLGMFVQNSYKNLVKYI